MSTPANQQLRILVVDDDDLNQRMMGLVLKREGHVAETASNGQEAVEAVKANAYDMILMDLQMPVMDGVEASRRIREWENGGGHTFIVALTASYMPERGRELFEAGIDNYIAKPFDIDHLRHILQYGLENRKIRTEARVTEPPTMENKTGFDSQVGIKRVGGDIEIYRELLMDFIHELPDKMGVLQVLFVNKDLDGLVMAAHNLKGVSAALGALQLSEHAQRLEKQVSEGYIETLENQFGDLKVVVEKLKENALNFLAA